LTALASPRSAKRLADPDLRRRILAEKPSDEEVSLLAQFGRLITTRWDRFFVMTDPPDCEPGGEMSAATIAARERTHARRGCL